MHKIEANNDKQLGILFKDDENGHAVDMLVEQHEGRTLVSISNEEGGDNIVVIRVTPEGLLIDTQEPDKVRFGHL